MKYDYVLIPCADKKGENGRFPEFRDGDYIGGENRMVAALRHSLNNQDTVYVPVGGFDHNNDSSEKVKDMTTFLKEGNPNIKIQAIQSLPCTRHNLVAFFNTMGDDLNGKKVAIVTSFCFVARTLAIWSKLIEEEFKGMPAPHIICSESFYNNDEVITKNVASYLQRIFREKQGLYDLEESKYVDFCLEKEKDGFIELAKKYPHLTSQKEKAKHKIKS